MARKRKRSLVGKIAIVGIFSLAVFGGYKLYQENSQLVNDKVNKIQTVAGEIHAVLTNKPGE